MEHLFDEILVFFPLPFAPLYYSSLTSFVLILQGETRNLKEWITANHWHPRGPGYCSISRCCMQLVVFSSFTSELMLTAFR